MENDKKVLVGSLTADIKDYCNADFITRVNNLTYPNFEFLLVDNSRDPSYHKYLQKLGANCKYVAPKGRNLRFVMAECNEVIRNRALELNADLMMIESDLFPPLNIIDTLQAHNKMCVTAPYFIRGGVDSVLMVQQIELGGFNRVSKTLENKESFKMFNGKLKQVFASGLGCTYIQNKVLKQIKFHVTEHDEGHADSFFYRDLYLKNIPAYIDTSLIIEHRNEGWGHIQQ